MVTAETRRRLLSEGGLHPLLADLIRTIDRLEADKHMPLGWAPMRALLEARDAYIEDMERE